MALTNRQLICYQHRANLWKPSRSVNSSTGVVGDETFSLVYSNVALLYVYTANINDPLEGVGRIKRPTIFTTDQCNMDSAQECGDDWLIANVSYLPDGSKSPLFGEVHRVLGAAQNRPSSGNRRANVRSFMIMSVEHPPAGVA